MINLIMIKKGFMIFVFVLFLSSLSYATHAPSGCSIDISMLTPTVPAPTNGLYKCSFNFLHTSLQDTFYDPEIENLCFADEECTSSFLNLPSIAPLSTPWSLYKKTDFSYGTTNLRFSINATPSVLDGKNIIVINKLTVTREDANFVGLLIRTFFNLTESTCSREYVCTDKTHCGEGIIQKVQDCRNGCNEYYTNIVKCSDVQPQARIPIISNLIDILIAMISATISYISNLVQL